MLNLKYIIPYKIDSPERTLFHKELIFKKKFLKRLYIEWYNVFLKAVPDLPDGKLLELGSGGGFLKKLIPEIITSDVLKLPNIDMNFSATDMPFEDNEVAAIFMIDTFHHIPDSKKFLDEVNRVLKKGGKIIMIEPANSVFGRFIYKNFHHEAFYPKGAWKLQGKGPMSDANGALPWIVFERDFERFNQSFPKLKLTNIKYHTAFRYLISGGVSFRQLVPNFMFKPIAYFEKFLEFFSKHFSMFVTIKILKI